MNPAAVRVAGAGQITNPPDWARWMAQDADGTWWCYEAEPNQQDRGWYENEVGRILRLGQAAPPADWTLTLTRLP